MRVGRMHFMEAGAMVKRPIAAADLKNEQRQAFRGAPVSSQTSSSTVETPRSRRKVGRNFAPAARALCQSILLE
jgi:hypothetical protein